jgi:hypothetical protein
MTYFRRKSERGSWRRHCGFHLWGRIFLWRDFGACLIKTTRLFRSRFGSELFPFNPVTLKPLEELAFTILRSLAFGLRSWTSTASRKTPQAKTLKTPVASHLVSRLNRLIVSLAADKVTVYALLANTGAGNLFDSSSCD